MRIIIGECRWCTRNRDECPYLQNIRKAIETLPGFTFTHKCKDYYRIIPSGTPVEVELKEIRMVEYSIDEGIYDKEPEWVSLGWVRGTMTDNKSGRRGIIVVKLDEPVELQFPSDGDWRHPRPKLVSYAGRRLNKIKVVNPCLK